MDAFAEFLEEHNDWLFWAALVGLLYGLFDDGSIAVAAGSALALAVSAAIYARKRAEKKSLDFVESTLAPLRKSLPVL